MSEPCSFLEWDTLFFSWRIGRANLRTLSEADLPAIEAWCAAERIDCLYLQIQADHLPSVRLAEAHAFQLMEVRLYMERRLSPDQPLAAELPAGLSIRPTQPADLPAMQDIAAVSYPYTRYHADPRLQPQWSAYYRTWVQNSLAGLSNMHLTAQHGAQVVGFISGQPDDSAEPPEEVFELMAVAPALRLGGIGRALLTTGMEWCRQHGRLRIRFATQASNIALQRSVQRLGFLSSACTLYYHRWFL